MDNVTTCFECGARMHLVREKAEMRMGARSAVIDVERFRCDECTEVFYSPEQMDAAQRELATKLRAQEDLLGPAHVRGIRERHSLTQVQFEQLLGVGPKTVVRWERGTVFQNRTTDVLLRLIDAVPGVFEFLVARNRLHIPKSARYATAPIRPEPTVRFAIPQAARSRKVAKVTDIREFGRVRQETAIRPDGETDLPSIPREALK